MNKVRKFVKSCKAEGFIPSCQRAYGQLKMKWLNATCYTQADKAHWETLRNHLGRGKLYIIGNGPSLNKTPLYLLKGKSTLCFNHFHIMEERINWKPTMFMCSDYLVIKDLLEEGFDMTADCQACFLPKIHQQGVRFDKLVPPSEKIFWLRLKGTGGYSNQMPDVYGSGSVVYPAIQVANFLGFDEIVLLGVDMNYKIQETALQKSKYYEKEVVAAQDDDPNHFDSRYFGKGKSFHQPKADIMQAQRDSFDYIGRNQRKYGTNIINAGYDSKVESFPKVDFIESLGYTKEQIRRLFEEMLADKTKYSSVQSFYESCDELKDISMVAEFTDKSFYIDVDCGVVLIKKMIQTHLPLGPYDGKYFFVRRGE